MAKRNNDDEPKDENINNDADDTFGLPEVEYEPLKRDEPVEEPAPVEQPVSETTPEPNPEEVETPVSRDEVGDRFSQEIEQFEEDHEEQTFHSQYVHQQEKPAVWPKVILIVLLIFVAGGALYYFAVYKPKKDKEIAAQILADKKRKDAAAKLRKEEEPKTLLRQEAEQRRADSLANIQKVGSIETLSGRTGQYYVVAASAIDDDLLMDFANKLIKQGTHVRVIPPFGKDAKFYRLAIEAKETYADAQAAADGMKGGDFGDQLWVVKY
jgi:hypothetical protein